MVGPACTPAATHHDPKAPAPVKAARAQPSHRQPARSPTDAGHPLVVTSTARAFCEALRHAVIPALPGYTDAPWEITPTSTPAHTAY